MEEFKNFSAATGLKAHPTHWTSKLLSYVGRLQLIKSIRFAVTSYWMQVFPLPYKVTHEIEAICRNFLWSGSNIINRKARISWDIVYDPKNDGGLNITTLREWNQATIGKLLWNIHSKKDNLWIRWVKVYYLKGCDVLSWEIATTCFWMIRKIVKSIDKLINTNIGTTSRKEKKFALQKCIKIYEEVKS